tara:strand:- start:2785 stop:3000 length:216 start_codon:yes stop_codon:yes gene_type:complete
VTDAQLEQAALGDPELIQEETQERCPEQAGEPPATAAGPDEGQQPEREEQLQEVHREGREHDRPVEVSAPV